MAWWLISNEREQITLPVVSATRNYTKQAEIWTNKWYGAYKNITGEVDRALVRVLFAGSMVSSVNECR